MIRRYRLPPTVSYWPPYGDHDISAGFTQRFNFTVLRVVINVVGRAQVGRQVSASFATTKAMVKWVTFWFLARLARSGSEFKV